MDLFNKRKIKNLQTRMDMMSQCLSQEILSNIQMRQKIDTLERLIISGLPVIRVKPKAPELKLVDNLAVLDGMLDDAKKELKDLESNDATN